MAKSDKKKKTRDPIRVFLHITGYTFIAVFFLITALIMAPRLFGYKTFCVVSASMAPELPVGSLVYVASEDPFELKEGDIIAYDSNGVTVTHRVVSNDALNKELHTKGDANQIEDMRPVAYDSVTGRVVYHLPYLGYLGLYLDSLIGRILFIVFGLTGIILTGV